jgi:hypothetical protein
VAIDDDDFVDHTGRGFGDVEDDVALVAGRNDDTDAQGTVILMRPWLK